MFISKLLCQRNHWTKRKVLFTFTLKHYTYIIRCGSQMGSKSSYFTRIVHIYNTAKYLTNTTEYHDWVVVTGITFSTPVILMTTYYSSILCLYIQYVYEFEYLLYVYICIIILYSIRRSEWWWWCSGFFLDCQVYTLGRKWK